MLATERPAVVLSPTAPFPSGSRSCVALGFPAAVLWSVIGARPAGERVTLLAAALTLPARNQACPHDHCWHSGRMQPRSQQ